MGSSDGFTNLEFRIYKTEKTILFWTNKKFVFFFICSNWEIFVEKIGKINWWKHDVVNRSYVRFRFCSTPYFPFLEKNIFIIFTWRIWSTLVRNFWWDMGGRQSLHSIGSYCWTERMQIDLILVNYEVSLPKTNSEKSNNTLNHNKMQRCSKSLNLSKQKKTRLKGFQS